MKKLLTKRIKIFETKTRAFEPPVWAVLYILVGCCSIGFQLGIFLIKFKILCQ